MVDTRHDYIMPLVKEFQQKVQAIELRMAEPDKKMDIFWKHMKDTKNFFEKEFTNHQEEIILEMKRHV